MKRPQEKAAYNDKKNLQITGQPMKNCPGWFTRKRIRLTRLRIINFRKVFPVGECKQHNCKGGGQIVRNRLSRCEHSCGVEDAPEQKKYRQINNSLTADGKD